MTDSLSFTQRLAGRFDGMIRVSDVERLGQAMAASDGWWLLEPGGDAPAQNLAGAEAERRLAEMVAEILQEERGVWSTMVYVQSSEDPWIIKVFHPRRAGCGCGGPSNVIPWRVFSRLAPEPLPAWSGGASCATPAASGAKPAKSWWRKLT